jgi:hypothetical protein
MSRLIGNANGSFNLFKFEKKSLSLNNLNKNKYGENDFLKKYQNS